MGRNWKWLIVTSCFCCRSIWWFPLLESSKPSKPTLLCLITRRVYDAVPDSFIPVNDSTFVSVVYKFDQFFSCYLNTIVCLSDGAKYPYFQQSFVRMGAAYLRIFNYLPCCFMHPTYMILLNFVVQTSRVCPGWDQVHNNIWVPIMQLFVHNH